MEIKKPIAPYAIVSVLTAALFCFSLSVAAKDHRPENAMDSNPEISVREMHDRLVDRAALESQVAAIQRLRSLLKSYHGTDREPMLLFRLGDAERQAGTLQFRINYGKLPTPGAPIANGSYRRYFVQSSLTLSELIRRFPKSPDLARAYYLRARSYYEAGQNSAASADFLHLVKFFSHSEDRIRSYIALAEIAMSHNQWTAATEYLHAVEKFTNDPHYPIALYRQAWCHYNLKDVARALAYLERNIHFYAERGESRSDEALKDNSLQDAALFFLEGHEQKLSHFGARDAYSYFKRLDEGPQLNRVLIRYAKLLRAHGHTSELSEWKTLVLHEAPKSTASLEILVIAYEDQLNKRQYSALVQTARELVAHQNPKQAPEAMARAQKLLLDAAGQLQTLISRNKDADGVASLTTSLAGLYDCFTLIVDEKDPRISKVHFNLAESLFEIGQFEQATPHYRWIVEHGEWNKTTANASLRSIASRYEELRLRGIIPKKLEARSLNSPMSANSSPQLERSLDEWIEWVDTHVYKTGMTVDNFYFEANRGLYAHGNLKLALERLHDFALKYPKSKFATPSATLIVDTLVKSNEWERLHSLSLEFLAVREWKNSEFSRKLYALTSEADFKTVEASYHSADFQGTVVKAEEFLLQYPASTRRNDCLAIAGHAALTAKDSITASLYFARLIKLAPGTEAAASALLAQASILEEQYDFASAAQEYRKYLALSPSLTKMVENNRKNLRKKILAFSWISENTSLLASSLKDPNICTPSLATECERFEALSYFERATHGPKLTARAFEHARHAPLELRAVWAALALEGARHLAFRDRHVAIRLLTQHFSELDSLTRMYLLSSISRSVPAAIALNRQNIRSVAPLLAREANLVRRMEAIREIENAGMEAAKLPWARLRASVANELADVYAETARSLRTLRGGTPAMAEPFQKKSETLRERAFQLASNQAIEADAFEAIAQPYLHADPLRLATLLPKEPLPIPQRLEPAQLSLLDPEGEWGTSNAICGEAAPCLKRAWFHAARNQHWAQAAYLTQLAREKKILPPGPLSLLRAYTLAGIGAQAEALHELALARQDVAARTRKNIARLLLEHYQTSLARQRVHELIEEMRNQGESVAQAPRQAKGG